MRASHLVVAAALYETSPLQRRLRDLHAAAQHYAAQPRHYMEAGKLLLNNSVPCSKMVSD